MQMTLITVIEVVPLRHLLYIPGSYFVILTWVYDVWSLRYIEALLDYLYDYTHRVLPLYDLEGVGS